MKKLHPVPLNFEKQVGVSAATTAVLVNIFFSPIYMAGSLFMQKNVRKTILEKNNRGSQHPKNTAVFNLNAKQLGFSTYIPGKN